MLYNFSSVLISKVEEYHLLIGLMSHLGIDIGLGIDFQIVEREEGKRKEERRVQEEQDENFHIYSHKKFRRNGSRNLQDNWSPVKVDTLE